MDIAFGKDVQRSAKARGSHGAPDERSCVLVVDDIAANLLAMEGILRCDDLAIALAHSAREALDILLERPVALAIVDVQMPEMNGIELVEIMRSVERTRHIPIIFVTASAGDYARLVQGYDAGAIDFLFKPIDDRVLRSKVDALVALDRQRRQLAIALEQAEIARRQAERARAETEFLFRLSESTSRCQTPEELYEPALDTVRALLGAERASILLLDRGKMWFRAWRGLSEAYRTTFDGRDPWPAEISEARPILFRDVARSESMAAYREVLAHEDIAALAFLPLVYQQQLLGSFVLYWGAPRDFSKHEENLAVTIASHIAQALERARLLELERRSRAVAEAAERRRGALQSISDSALAHVDLDTLLGEMLARVCRIFGADTATLLLTDAEQQHLVGAACSGIDRSVWKRPAAPIPLERGIAGRIAREGRPIVVDDVTSVEVAWPEIDAQRGSLAGIPLRVGQDLLGVLHIGFAEHRTFSREDMELLVAVGERVATAVDRTVAYETLHRTEERLRIALDSGQLGIWEWVPARGTVTWSPKFEEIHGYAPGTFPRTFEAYERVLHPDDRERVLADIRRHLETKHALLLEYRIIRPDGQVRWIAGRGKVFVDAKGQFASFTCICLDETDRAEFERLREKALADLKRDLQLNEMFVGILGHDLRNPLGSISMASELLAEQGELSQPQRQTVQRIAAAGDRMRRLVAQLLDVTRSRLGGGIPIDRKLGDLAAIVRELVAEFELSHPKRAFVLDGDASIEGRWDGDRIAQLVSNLVGNALIHGGSDAVVRISATTDAKTARLRVHNGGKPIAPDVLPTIFEPYVRGRRGLQGGGLGLGLYISSQIAHAHGGTIGVTSSEADGTAFTVALPR